MVVVVASRLEKFNPDQVINVQVDVTVEKVCFELFKENIVLLKGVVSGMII